jgi:hypothetical protein
MSVRAFGKRGARKKLSKSAQSYGAGDGLDVGIVIGRQNRNCRVGSARHDAELHLCPFGTFSRRLCRLRCLDTWRVVVYRPHFFSGSGNTEAL